MYGPERPGAVPRPEGQPTDPTDQPAAPAVTPQPPLPEVVQPGARVAPISELVTRELEALERLDLAAHPEVYDRLDTALRAELRSLEAS